MLTVICMAKGTSKRLPNKNMIDLCGKPLIQHTIDIIKRLPYKSAIISDSSAIKNLATTNGLRYVDQPEYYTRDETDRQEIMEWVHKEIQSEFYLMLPATSPIRDLKEMIDLSDWLLRNRIKSAYSVAKVSKYYFDSGLFFFFHYSVLGCLKNDDSLLFIDKVGLDIDTEEDLIHARKLWERRAREN